MNYNNKRTDKEIADLKKSDLQKYARAMTARVHWLEGQLEELRRGIDGERLEMEGRIKGLDHALRVVAGYIDHKHQHNPMDSCCQVKMRRDEDQS